MERTVLLLGGTTEARGLAAALHGREGVRTITSLAGRLATPAEVAGEVRTGGFGGAAELSRWIRDHGIAAVIDATHPFAAGISQNAAEACAAARVPLVALRRPGWTPRPGDDWHEARDLADAAARVAGLGRRVLLAIGRQEVRALAEIDDAWFLIRAIEAPDGPLPPHHELVLARGPFGLEDERRLLAEHAIDLVVAKDAGGDATRAKLDAAGERGIPVLLVRRPAAPDRGGTVVETVEDAVLAVRTALHGRAGVVRGAGVPGA